MVAFSDTSFLTSLYLRESTTVAARAAIAAEGVSLPLTPLGGLELRNALNRAVHRQRATVPERDAMWRDVESDLAKGFLVRVSLDAAELHAKARELSDRYTPTTGARSLDLLHVAAALLLDAQIFFSFD